MLRIGLTGGIGSGKSTVAAMFADLGAHVIDADRLARDVVEPGTEGLAAIAGAFGDGILRKGGSLDRRALAAVIFDDPRARATLNGIVHPLVRRRTASRLAAIRAGDPGAVVVQDVPLLYEADLAADMDLVVVVSAAPQVRLARALRRGMTEGDVRARMAGQATDAERESIAHVVLDNNGDEDDLRGQVARCWREHVLGAAQRD